MSAHTAGNWRFEMRPDSADSDRPLVVAGTELICAVSRLGGNRRESEANANLIAAAPDLLEACRQASADLEHYLAVGDNQNLRQLVDQIDFAIAKAAGGAP